MCNICILFAVLLGASIARQQVLVSAELRDILKLCDYVNCDPRSDPKFQHQEILPHATYKLMTAGVPQIFWDDVRSGKFFHRGRTISKECRRELETISTGLSDDESFAYSFIDASGKTPAAMLRSTMTAMGDYDQCLAIDSHGLRGKYCMMDMFAMKQANVSTGKVDLGRVSKFSGFPHWTSMCFPSGCHEGEMREALADLMRPYGMKVAGDFSCDTARDISWINRMSNMTRMQVLAGLLVFGFATLVALCTAHDFYNRFLFGNITAHDPILPQPEAMKSLSMLESAHKLLYSKPLPFDILVFEFIKVCVILPVSPFIFAPSY